MTQYINPSEIRRQFAAAMSAMYQQEVPLYSELISLVKDVNQSVLINHPTIKQYLQATGELDRLDTERHGAIRLGLPEELSQIRQLFAVMGMRPVGYYDLVPAGIPVHATAFRAVNANELQISPFRVFTSLLRLDLIDDFDLRQTAKATLRRRQIFTPKVLELIKKNNVQNGLDSADAREFVKEALETFRWHDDSRITKELYDKLNKQHRLIADVIGFKGPHINHLTPRTLDIDAVQTGMSQRGIIPKAIIEGPPPRNCPILLRQTSFKALEETIKFSGNITQDKPVVGTHTARFGEIEQRGVAVTAKGHSWYDNMLADAREKLGENPDETNADQYMELLTESFSTFPDDYRQMAEQGLGYFYYNVTDKATVENLHLLYSGKNLETSDLPSLLDHSIVQLEPIVYEDFLPVSAAGIFQSNLGKDSQESYQQISNQAIFEQSLGTKIIDSDNLYQITQQQSLDTCLEQLNNLIKF